MELVGKQVAITRYCMRGNTPTKDDEKYIGRAMNRVVRILHKFDDGSYLTNFFMPEYINEKHDYCHYGFLVIDYQVLTRLSN